MGSMDGTRTAHRRHMGCIWMGCTYAAHGWYMDSTRPGCRWTQINGTWVAHGWHMGGTWVEHGWNVWNMDGTWVVHRQHALCIDGTWAVNERHLSGAWKKHVKYMADQKHADYQQVFTICIPVAAYSFHLVLFIMSGSAQLLTALMGTEDLLLRLILPGLDGGRFCWP